MITVVRLTVLVIVLVIQLMLLLLLLDFENYSFVVFDAVYYYASASDCDYVSAL